MADSNQVINLQTKGDGEIKKATNSLKQLKQELKEAQAAALNGDGAAAARVAELRDRLEDVRDATHTLQGSGVERVGNSFSMLGEGLMNFDWDKIKIGFQGIGAALGAIPIFLVAEGIKLLIENFDKVSGAIKDFFGVTNQAEQDVKRLTETLEQEKKVTSGVVATLENHIKILEAQGGKESQILQIKKELVAIKIKELQADIELQKAKIQELLTNDSLWESTERLAAAYQRKLGNDVIADQIEASIQKAKLERAKEYADKIREDMIGIQNLRTEQTVEEIKTNKVLVDRAKERADKIHKSLADAADEEAKQLEKDAANDQKRFDEKQALEQKQFDAAENLRKEEDAKEVKDYEDKLKYKAALREKELKDELAADIQRVKTTSDAMIAIQGLSDTVFAIRMANVKKGSAEEEAAARKQFQINKALQIATATINGAQALTAILAVPDFTLGVTSAIRIAAAIATTAATIAKISATQFQVAGGGAGGGSISLPSGIGGGLPQVNSAPPRITQGSTLLNGNFGQNNQPIKTYVVESEMTNAQRRVKRLGDQATF